MWNCDLGRIKITKLRFALLQPDTTPVYSAAYQAGPKTREVEKAESDKIFAKYIIEQSLAEWAAPIILLLKKDGSFRFCVDYRKLNAVVKRDCYPIPRTEECIDLLGKATVFLALNTNKGYRQIEFDDADKDMTKFTFHHGLYCFLCLPFELRYALRTIKRTMNVIFLSVK